MRRDVHQALDVVLDELDEQAERRDAGDVAVEDVADLVGHEPHLLPLQQLALGLVGAPLASRRCAGRLRQILFELLAPLVGDSRVPQLAEQRDARPDPDSAGSAT